MSTYSNLKFELIGTGEQSGSWGTTTNTNLGTAIEQALVGTATLATGDFSSNVATLTLTNTNAAQNARALCLNITATLSAAGTVNVPAIEKPYIIINNSVGGYAVTVKVSGQTGVSVPNGKRTVVYNNATDVGNQIDYLSSLAQEYNGYLYTSTDSGVTWTQRTSPGTQQWYGLAISGNGSIMYAAAGYADNVYKSTDSGATWSQISSLGLGLWRGITCSSDGQIVATMSASGSRYVSYSSNGGTTWSTTPTSPGLFESMACSGSGQIMFGTVGSDQIKVSTDFGATWAATSSPTTSWFRVACNSSGAVILAGSSNSYWYSSP